MRTIKLKRETLIAAMLNSSFIVVETSFRILFYRKKASYIEPTGSDTGSINIHRKVMMITLLAKMHI